MHPDPALVRLDREVRALRRLVAALALVLLMLGAAAFQSARHPRFAEIDVERINVVEPDGRYAVVIANQARLPGVVMDGRERGDREGMAGLIFFNSEGDESGGLIHSSERTEDGVRAFGHFSIDRFESDQVVALNYMERPGYYGAGLRVSDFALGGSKEWYAAQDSIDALPEAERGAARVALRQRFMREGKWEINRVFVGQEQGTAGMRVHDAAGNLRIRIGVDSLNVARLEFLDEQGTVIQALPDR